MTCITRLLPMVTRSPCFGRGRLTLPYPSRKHQRRRAVQTGLSEHFSQQQNPGDRRSATGGRRRANQPVRVREILLYLAEKTGKLLSKGLRERAATLQWLFWQVAGFGPMLGQNHHFNHYAPQPVPYAIERYQLETKRLYGVLEAELQNTRTWAATTTASPISPPTRGWCRIRASASIWRITRRCATGSSASATARRPSAPISWLNRANPAPRLDSPPPGSHIALRYHFPTFRVF